MLRLFSVFDFAYDLARWGSLAFKDHGRLVKLAGEVEEETVGGGGDIVGVAFEIEESAVLHRIIFHIGLATLGMTHHLTTFECVLQVDEFVVSLAACLCGRLGRVFEHIEPQTTGHNLMLAFGKGVEIVVAEECEHFVPKLLVGVILFGESYGVD